VTGPEVEFTDQADGGPRGAPGRAAGSKGARSALTGADAPGRDTSAVETVLEAELEGVDEVTVVAAAVTPERESGATVLACKGAEGGGSRTGAVPASGADSVASGVSMLGEGPVVETTVSRVIAVTAKEETATVVDVTVVVLGAAPAERSGAGVLSTVVSTDAVVPAEGPETAPASAPMSVVWVEGVLPIVGSVAVELVVDRSEGACAVTGVGSVAGTVESTVGVEAFVAGASVAGGAVSSTAERSEREATWRVV
jgi:hypothetical protein